MKHPSAWHAVPALTALFSRLAGRAADPSRAPNPKTSRDEVSVLFLETQERPDLLGRGADGEGAESERALATLGVAEALGLVSWASFLALRAATALPHRSILRAVLDLEDAGLALFEPRPGPESRGLPCYIALTPKGREAIRECRTAVREVTPSTAGRRSAEDRFAARCFGGRAS